MGGVRIRLLLLEQDATGARSLHRALNNSGSGQFDIVSAENLASALGQIKSGHFDAVLADLEPTGSSWRATVNEITASCPELPLVVLMADRDDELAAEAISSGAQDYLVKEKLNGALIAHVLHSSIERNRFRLVLNEANAEMASRIAAHNAELQLANSEARENEMRYRALAELSSDWYWEQDENLRFTRMSKPDAGLSEIEIDTFLGHTRGEAPGIVWDTEELAQLDAIVAARGEFRDFEIGRIYQNGPKHYVRMSGAPIFDAAGVFKGYRGVGTDVTERRLALEQLRASEARYRAVADSANDAIITSDAAGRIVGWNSSAQRLFGYTDSEIIGRPLTLLMPDRYRQRHLEGMRRVQSGREPQIIGRSVELVGRRKHGTEFPMELSLSRWSVEEGQFLTGIIRDITDHKVAQQKIQRLTQLYAVLSQCNEAIVRCESEDQLFRKICQVAVDVGGMRMAWIGLWDSATETIQVAACHGDGLSENLCRAGTLRDIDALLIQSATALFHDGSQPVWCQDLSSTMDAATWQRHIAPLGLRASASLPLHRRGAFAGALALYAGEVDAFDDSAQRLLVEMQTDIDFALGNFARDSERTRAQQAQAASEKQLRFVTNNAPVCIAHCDQERRYRFVNLQYAMLFARQPDDIIGKHPREILGEEAYAHASPYMDLALAGRAVEYDLALPNAPDGPRTVHVSYVPERNTSGDVHGFLAAIVDVTEHQEMEHALRAGEEQFRGLVEQSIAGIYIIQDDKFVYVNPRLAEIFGFASADEVIGRDAVSLIVEKDRAAAVESIHKRIAGEAASGNYLYLGLRKDGSTVEVGVHDSIVSRNGRPAVIGLLQDISEKLRAEERIEDYVAQLQTAFMSTVRVATTLSELRDPYTAGHERRVGEIAVAIAGELGFDKSRLEGLRVAGYLHDIGKITIPAEILSKPGKLSQIEFQLIRTHARASYDVLKEVKFPWPVAEVVLQHHERLDGSGYPEGLKGEAILLEARILAVADVVEAMSSHRPYREARGTEAALAEIASGSGKLYDAAVAEVCLRLFREQGYEIPA